MKVIFAIQWRKVRLKAKRIFWSVSVPSGYNDNATKQQSRRKYCTMHKTETRWGSSSFQSTWTQSLLADRRDVLRCLLEFLLHVWIIKWHFQATDASQQCVLVFNFIGSRFFSSSSGQCDCTKHKQEDSPECSGRGALQCGKCMCRAPYVGRRCHTDIETALSDDSRCRLDADSPVCSNNGVCVDGFCVCRLRENPQERYSGQFCECSNFNCDRSGNRQRCTVWSYPSFPKLLFAVTIMFSLWQTLWWSRAVWVRAVRMWRALGGRRLQLLHGNWHLHGQKQTSV